MARYAQVQNSDGKVLNIIEWDGVTPFDPGADNSMIDTAGAHAQAGMFYQNNVFVPGAPPTPKLIFFATSTLVVKKNDIVSISPTWEELGVVTSTPSFFYAPGNVIGRLVGSVKSTGNGIEMQIVEEKDDGTRTVMSSAVFAPAVNADFKTFGFQTNVPPSAGQNRYILEARLKDGSATGSVKGVSLSLFGVS